MTEEIAALLSERGKTLAVAESCTGGRLAAAFTAAPGASEYFLGGVVAYANEVKARILGVSLKTLWRHGAVSSEVAVEMACGARRITGADFAVATTGIAGPGGGTPEKPVGTVWVAVACLEKDGCGGVGEGVETKLFRFTGTRAEIMESAVAAAIEMLRKSLA